MKKLHRKAAEALVDSPIELTQADLPDLQIIGAFRKNNRLCIAARTEFPIFIWKEDGKKDKCPAGGYVVLDEDGVLKLISPERFEGVYEPLRVPSFYDSAIFYPDPTLPVPDDPIA